MNSFENLEPRRTRYVAASDQERKVGRSTSTGGALGGADRGAAVGTLISAITRNTKKGTQPCVEGAARWV